MEGCRAWLAVELLCSSEPAAVAGLHSWWLAAASATPVSAQPSCGLDAAAVALLQEVMAR